MPQGQILLHGAVLSPPYEFKVLGESSVLRDVLELPGGIFDRLEDAYPGINISVERKDILQIN